MKMIRSLALLALAGATLAGTAARAAEALQVDPELSAYKKNEAGVSGTLNSIGSDTLNELMTLWNEDFHKLYEGVQVQVEGKGSGTAPPALIEGTAQLGPMSRPMTPDEIQKFEDRHGYRPTAIAVALDALAVFTHKDNPIQSLTLPQVDAIFSRTYRGGLGGSIATWGELGLGGAWASRPISLFGRNSASGTYGFFKEKALYKGDFKETVKEQPGSSSVVNGVSQDVTAIGYSGIGYVTASVKPLALAKMADDEAYAPSYENVLSQKYPLARALLIYVAKAPGQRLDPVAEEFLKYVLSKEGQQVVVKAGYLPMTAAMVKKQLEQLN